MQNNLNNMKMETLVTKTNQEGVKIFYSVLQNYKSIKGRKQVRRTGKTQTWKTRPLEFKIPVKFGLYESFYITEKNAHEFSID